MSAYADRVCDLLGLKPGDPAYADAHEMAEAGMRAWQIAQRMGASPVIVEKLKIANS